MPLPKSQLHADTHTHTQTHTYTHAHTQHNIYTHRHRLTHTDTHTPSIDNFVEWQTETHTDTHTDTHTTHKHMHTLNWILLGFLVLAYVWVAGGSEHDGFFLSTFYALERKKNRILKIHSPTQRKTHTHILN